jgi:hypothetical protein
VNRFGKENPKLDRYTLSLAIVITVGILKKGIPPVKIFSFDIFSIHFPILLLFASFLYVVCLKKEFIYETNFLLVILFIIYICIGVINIQEYSIHFPQIYTYLSYGILLTTLIVFIKKEIHITAATYTLIFVTTLLVAIAAWEFVTGQHLPVSRLSLDPRGRYASTIYLNRNNFGFFLGMMSPILMYERLYNSERKYMPQILSIIILSSMIIIILNGSRAALISYIAGLVIIPFFIFLKKSDRQIQRWPRISFLTYLFVATVSVVAPFFFSSQFETERFSSLITRWELMRGGSKYIRTHLTEPAGLGMFEAAVPIAGQTVPNTPHNWAIQLGVETGLIGLLLFIITIGMLCDMLFSLYYTYQADRALPIAVSLLLFPINGLGPSNVLHQSLIFWIFVGLGIATVIISKIDSNE